MRIATLIVGIAFASTALIAAEPTQEQLKIRAMVQEIKLAGEGERFELMNAFKEQLRTMNEQSRQDAIAELQGTLADAAATQTRTQTRTNEGNGEGEQVQTRSQIRNENQAEMMQMQQTQQRTQQQVQQQTQLQTKTMNGTMSGTQPNGSGPQHP